MPQAVLTTAMLTTLRVAVRKTAKTGCTGSNDAAFLRGATFFFAAMMIPKERGQAVDRPDPDAFPAEVCPSIMQTSSHEPGLNCLKELVNRISPDSMVYEFPRWFGRHRPAG